MCNFDRKTGRKTADCGRCSCGQSSSYGNHSRVLSHYVPVGKTQIAAYKCGRCGVYLGT